MKATISKSKVMTRAWRIFKSGHSFYSSSFSVALARAWEVEKENQANEIKKIELASMTNTPNNIAFDMMLGLGDSLMNFYANNTYNRD